MCETELIAPCLMSIKCDLCDLTHLLFGSFSLGPLWALRK